MRFFVALVVVMSSAAQATTGPNLPALRRMLELPETSVDLVQVKLRIDRMIDPQIDAQAVARTLDDMAASIRAQLPTTATKPEILEALRKHLYQPGPWNDGMPFRYDLDDPLGRTIRNKLLPIYLTTRRGNCVSMPFLFLLLGQKLGLDVSAAMAPEHIFVIFRDEKGNVTNVEATSGGYKLDETYQRDLPMTPEAIKNGLYMRALTKQETVALMAVILMEFYGQEHKVEERIAVANLLMEFYPNNVTAMLHMGHAYAQLIERDFKSKYDSPAAIPLAERARFVELRQASEIWYNKAEALGWRQPSQAQEINYRNIIERAKRASQGEK